MNLSDPNSGHWRHYAFSLIFCFVILLSLKWSFMPTFMDIFYHLSVMLGFNEAGGFVSNAFWEFAPVGRPHLYPPLMHLLMLIFYKFGFSALTIARLFEFIIYPITVITLWWASEKLFNSRMAFFTTLISLSVYSFYLSIIILIPSTLAMILAMLSFVFLERKRILASSLLLGLSFYAHAITPWLFLSIFILYFLLNEKISKDGFKVVLFGLIVALPILIYQFNNKGYLNLSVTLKELPIEINLWLLLLFIPGLLISFRRRGRYSFFIVLFITYLVSTFSPYRYRFISGQGVIGFLFLSSVALDRAYGRVVNFLDKKPRGDLDAIFVFILILLCFLVFSPTLLIQEDGLGFKILNSTYINLVSSDHKIERAHEYSIFFPKFYKSIKASILENSNQDDIIFCNNEFVCGIFSVMTGRATSTAMLKEVYPYKIFDQIAVSKLIIWIKKPEEVDSDKPADEQLISVVKEYNLKEIKGSEIAYIYENPKATAQKITSKPLLSNGLLFFILFLFIGLIAWDIRKRQGGQDGN